MSTDLKHRSRVLTEGTSRAGARAQLRGLGLDDEDFEKPVIGVANTWIETMPCNLHLRALAKHVKDGIRDAGAIPMELNTIAISDGITMGTPGMKASLVSRELVADSIELVARAHHFDGLVALTGCDKTIPGAVMALARLDLPSLMLYGGSIHPGVVGDREITIQEVFEAIGATRRAASARPSWTTSSARDARARARAAGSSRPTRWRWPSSCWASARRQLDDRPRSTDAQGQAAYDAGRLVDGPPAARRRPARQIITRESFRTRSPAVAATRRLDERGDAPAGGRARGGRAAVDRRLRRVSERTPCCATCSRAGATRRSTWTAPAASRSGRERLHGAASPHDERADGHRADARDEVAELRVETPGQDVVAPPTTR